MADSLRLSRTEAVLKCLASDGPSPDPSHYTWCFKFQAFTPTCQSISVLKRNYEKVSVNGDPSRMTPSLGVSLSHSVLIRPPFFVPLRAGSSLIDEPPPFPQVLRLGASSDDESAAAFRARGLAVEDLCEEGGGELTLRALDRFMVLAEGAGRAGPMAIQFEEEGGGGLGRAGTLIAAWMLRGGRFGSSGEALAWLRMAVPGPALALERGVLRCAAAPASLRRAPSRSISFTADAPPGARRPPVRCASLCDDVLDRAADCNATAAAAAPTSAAAAAAGKCDGAPVCGGARRPAGVPRLLRTQSSFSLRARRAAAQTTAPGPGVAAGPSYFCVE